MRKRSSRSGADEAAAEEEKRRWFARRRGEKFGELLRDGADEGPPDDDWIVRLDQARAAEAAGAEAGSAGTYAETAGQWSELALDVDLAREAVAAMERLEGCLSALDDAVTRTDDAARDARALLDRVRAQVMPPATSTGRSSWAAGAASTASKKPAAKKRAAKKAAARKSATKKSAVRKSAAQKRRPAG